MSRPLKLISWNVNGLRSAARCGLLDWLGKEKPDILCLQETKADPGQVEEIVSRLSGYHVYFNSAKRKGYSGVATWTRAKPARVISGMGIPKFDEEGRVLITEFPSFALYNVYFPNGGRDLSRVPFKLEFYGELLRQLNARKQKGEHLVVCGDYNTAHKEIDLKNPKSNQGTSGFLPEEREWLDRYIKEGYMDVFRRFHPEPERYTWWSYMFNARARNIGWRIDYHLVSENSASRCVDAYHLPDVPGSDHCPVALIWK
ncbi:MAG: exodeoxyribonuclease III [Candidatus Omnitrophica bacterium]|nr:exodeoxyribonuclease III [Candidatus Omnitrophota bacterium]